MSVIVIKSEWRTIVINIEFCTQDEEMMGTGRGSGNCHLVAVAVSTRWMIRTTRWCLRRDWKAKRRLFHPLGWKWAEESAISISRSRARVFQLFHQRRRKMRRCVGLIAARTKNERALHLLYVHPSRLAETRAPRTSRIADLIPIRLAGKKVFQLQCGLLASLGR